MDHFTKVTVCGAPISNVVSLSFMVALASPDLAGNVAQSNECCCYGYLQLLYLQIREGYLDLEGLSLKSVDSSRNTVFLLINQIWIYS